MSRLAYALETLRDEILALHKDAEVKLGEPDGLDVIRSATFGPVPKSIDEAINLGPDPRIAGTHYARKQLTVELQSRSPLADDRSPFYLAGVHEAPAAPAPTYEGGAEVEVPADADAGDGAGD